MGGIWLGCAPGAVPPEGSGGATESAGPGRMVLSCASSPENALRATCNVEVEPAGSVVLTQSCPGLPPRDTTSGFSSTHDVELIVLPPTSECEIVAVASDGRSARTTVTTGPVPEGVATELVAPAVLDADWVLFDSPCCDAAAVILYKDGTPVWYQSLAETPGATVEALTFTDQQTVLVLLTDLDAGLNDVVEYTLYGQEIGRLVGGVHFGDNLHHDVVRWNEWTYVVFREIVMKGGEGWKLDGFQAFDAGGGLVGEWHFADWFEPVSFQPAPGDIFDDYTHTNSIFVHESGDVVLSLRHLSAVIRVAGDFGAADFGQVRWTLAGNPDDTDLPSDFTLVAEEGPWASFVEQHHAVLEEDGRLRVFDNREAEDENSRVLQIVLDEAAGVATIERAWDLARHCRYQGGAYAVGDGMLATCAVQEAAVGFDAGGAIVADMDLECACGFSGHVPRFIPIAL